MHPRRFCEHHPTLKARWHCATCGVDYCADCVDKNRRLQRAQCQTCESVVEQLPSMNFTAPFWSRVSEALAYPLKGQIPVGLGLLSILFSVGWLGFIPGWLAVVWFGLGFSRYLLSILESAGAGNRQPPAMGLDLLTDGMWVGLKHVALVMALVTASGVALTQGYGMAGAVAAVAFATALPASIILFAFDYSFLEAINPIAWWRTMRQIGHAYWLLFVLVAGGFGFSAIMAIVLTDVSGMLLPVAVLFALVVITAGYFLLGAAIFQYHDAINYGVVVDLDMDNARTPAAPRTPAHEILIKAENLIHGGRRDEAMTLLRDFLQRNSDPEIYARYLSMLKESGKTAEILHVATEYLNVLLHAKQWERAAAMMESARHDGYFVKPGDPDVFLSFAQQLARRGDGGSAVQLLSELVERRPQHADAPSAFMLLARTLSERLHNDEMALKYLNLMRQTFPDHPLAAQAAEMVRALEYLRKHAP